MSRRRYSQVLALALAGLTLLSLVEPRFPRDQLLQLAPLVVALPLLVVAGSRDWLADRELTCVFVFLVLHVLGARWVYSFVPGGERLGLLALGQEAPGRNHYDRLVHLAFGALALPVVVELARRRAGLRRGAALVAGLLAVVALSAGYEVFEWALAQLADSARADRYNGQQGDPWDAQKDMALAGLGALLVAAPLARRLLPQRLLGPPAERRVELLAGVVPALLVSELRTTLAFYEGLGFTLSRAHPDRAAPVWAELRRGPIVLQFHCEPSRGAPRRPACSGTLYVETDGVEALAEELADRVPFEWGPQVMPYGRRELAVRDPDGYLLAFTEPA